MSEKIQRYMRIVPDVFFEQDVEYHSDGKLDAGYNERTRQAADNRVQCREPVAQNIENQQHRAARQGHRPVRVAAKNHLDEVIYHRTEEKDKDITKPVFQYHHRAYF